MKYNFDEVVDRIHEEGSYSSKWSDSPRSAAQYLSDTVPEDRFAVFLADMDFRCAPEIREALQKVVDHGIFGYSSAPNEYYEAVCRWMNDRFGMNVKPDEVFPCRGAHTAIIDLINKLTKPGDGVIVPLPTYYYRSDVSGTGRHYCGFQMHNDNGYYTFDFDKFEELCKEPTNTMAIFMQPHNPVGRIWTEEEIKKMAKICRDNNVIMLCDDVHMDIARRDKKVVPFINVVGPEGIVMVTGVNKTFNTAGLAITNTICQDPALKEKLTPSFGMSPFSIAAGIAAYTKGDQWVDELNEYLDECLDYVIDRFHKELPKVKVWKPEGTYILWIDFTDLGYSSEELDQRIAGTAHISMSNGAGMEPPAGQIFRRFCVTAPKSVLAKVMDRLVSVLK
ncbi:MAG: aminotransferase class I/II-fold pyridoxal phosphate-dependent enzyme [Erysipelotrichaceae bacterium]|nr:aminotransferase class I/II-fold pyridoxal phosphate-dependent enzyme [Erysipelotrichaceae bacterium]